MKDRNSEASEQHAGAARPHVIVCGSRSWDDWSVVDHVISQIRRRYGDDVVVVHGGARGADRMAGYAARKAGLDVIVEAADWDRHGKRAGILRNARMLSRHQPVAVIGLSHRPVTRGTAHMLSIAQRAGVRVWRVGAAPMPVPEPAWCEVCYEQPVTRANSTLCDPCGVEMARAYGPGTSAIRPLAEYYADVHDGGDGIYDADDVAL
jgi:hypothetical protein